ncbi:MAG: ABC transporter permease, partial [Geminicoccaceae bacterium]|nr:ABC transporter permease [Geminicoccaceae bacterium]
MTFDLRRRHRAPLRRHWRIARRDLRGSLGSFAIFFACTALGVATIATVGVLNAGITRTLERDASSLLGGDVEIEQPNNALADAEIDALVPAGARLSRTVRTNAIVFDAEGDSLAVELKAIDGAYPLYGGLETAPPGLRPGEGGALVEEGVLTRLGVEVGDTLELGSGRVTIDGVVRREPDRIGGYVGLGPRLMVDWRTLESLDVLVPGALARYGYRLALAEPDSAETVAADLQNRHPEATWRARSARDVQPRVARFTDRLATYLMMAGLTALVIGGLGIGLSVRAYLEGKTASIATLRSLGARAADITRIYGLQLGALAVGGTAIGVASGQALPFVLAPLASGLFPVDIEATIEPLPLLYAGACGLVTVALFAWLPLARCR